MDDFEAVRLAIEECVDSKIHDAGIAALARIKVEYDQMNADLDC